MLWTMKSYYDVGIIWRTSVYDDILYKLRINAILVDNDIRLMNQFK